MMAARDRDLLLEMVCRVAREARVPEPDPEASARMIQNALGRSRKPAAPSRARAALFVASAAAAAAAVVIAARALSGPQTSTTGQEPAIAFTLPSGDRIAASPAAEFELAAASKKERRIEIARGALRFEVRPLGAGERFEVRTPHLEARVVGTVFSVEVQVARSVVRVESGVVDVTVDGRRFEVRAGAALDSRRLAVEAASKAELGERGPAGDREVRAGGRAVAPAVLRTGGTSALRAPLASGAERQSTSRGRLDRTPRTARLDGFGGDDPATARGDGHDQGPRDTGADAGSGAESDSASAYGAASARRLAAARQLIVAGEYARALELARTAGPDDAGAWRVIEGDALRGLGRNRDAAEAYLSAAGFFDAPGAAVAGFLAAQRFHVVGDQPAAEEALDLTRADRPGSPLEERALGLRLRVQVEAGNQERARATAAIYLKRFPDGSLRELAEAL